MQVVLDRVSFGKRLEFDRDRLAQIEELEHAWVDVRVAAHGWRVPEVPGNLLARLDDDSPPFCFRANASSEDCDGERSQNSRVPSAEVLGRERAVAGLLDVLVDVDGSDIDPAGAVPVGKQLRGAATSLQMSQHCSDFVVHERSLRSCPPLAG